MFVCVCVCWGQIMFHVILINVFVVVGKLIHANFLDCKIETLGSLPGFETVEPADTDVQEALAAMELDDDGTSRLNFFIQVFRSGDYPIYEDYAVHRNAEGTPFQIIVTK